MTASSRQSSLLNAIIVITALLGIQECERNQEFLDAKIQFLLHWPIFVWTETVTRKSCLSDSASLL